MQVSFSSSYHHSMFVLELFSDPMFSKRFPKLNVLQIQNLYFLYRVQSILFHTPCIEAHPLSLYTSMVFKPSL